jgi:DNA-binding response OmpR family regulator
VGSSTRLDLRELAVLLVDDNPQSAELLGQILMGFRVQNTTWCSTVESTREALSSRRFDLILIDGELPDEQGINLVREVRLAGEGANASAPIMLVSGHTPKERIAQARDVGVNLVIKTPVAPGVLLDRIEWLAQCRREFIVSEGYRGPDRRFQRMPLPEGVEERRAEALALMGTLGEAVSQEDVDALFG